MNKFIKEQLERIKCNMSEWNDNTTQITFYKQVNTKDILQVNGFYRIKLSNFMLQESKLSSNWNKCVIPVQNIMEICVTKIVNSMVQVNGVGFDEQTNTQTEDRYLNFWIPISEITVLGEYK